jgi:hypothetical protein
VEPENSLLFLQEPVTGSYPEPDQSVHTTSFCFSKIHFNIVTCQRIARQRLDKEPALHARNNRTAELCNPFLGNGSVNTFPRRQ